MNKYYIHMQLKLTLTTSLLHAHIQKWTLSDQLEFQIKLQLPVVQENVNICATVALGWDK